MKRFESISVAIKERWGKDPAVPICLSILTYAAAQPPQSEIMLTYGDLRKITGKSYKQPELQRAVTILVQRYSALQLRLMFVDEEGKSYYLNNEELDHLFESGILSHPRHGHIVEDAKSKTFPYYIASPSSLLEEVG